MRIVHLADVHLGIKTKALGEVGEAVNIATRNAFKRVIDKIIGLKPDVVVIAGDLFEKDFGGVSAADIYTAMEALSKLWERGITVIGIEGNHDKPKYLDLPDIKDIESPLRLLERSHIILRTEYIVADRISPSMVKQEIEDLQKKIRNSYGDVNFDIVIKEIPGATGVYEKYVIVDDTAFVGIQYTPVNKFISMSQKFFEFIRLFSRVNYETPKKVFIAHQTVEGIVSSDFIKYLNEQAIELRYLPKGFDYYALGHIHQYNVGSYDNAYVVYPGSITLRDAGEFDYTFYEGQNSLKKNKCWDKGLVAYDLENKDLKRIRVKSVSSLTIKVVQKDQGDFYSSLRNIVRQALMMLKKADSEFLESEGDIVDENPAILVEVKAGGERPLDDVLLKNIVSQTGAYSTVRVEYDMKKSVYEANIEEGDSTDMEEILRKVFGEKYTYYLDVVESIGKKDGMSVDNDADAFIKALRASLEILLDDPKEIEETFGTLVKYVFKHVPITLSARSPEKEQSEKPREKNNVEKKTETQKKPLTTKKRSLFDYL
ncbi:MAG: DNA repair exonuclease [Euryarchaeota archaeon]|nr:DNA repair exonuclease [Euryarchaeota archaeon]